MFAAAAAAGLALAAGQAAAEPQGAAPTCPTDPLAPLRTPQVQIEVQPRTDGGAASYGGMQYRRTPGLGPKDIALTIDDGPNPQVTPLVLKILAKHCLKVTYFLVGWYAHAYPDLVRQEADAGHFIGTHTYTHPDNIRRLTTAAAEDEITKGFDAAEDALANGTPAERAQLAPFFRFPGLNDTKELSQWLAQRRIAIVGADFGANDWLNITPAAIEHRALLEAAETHGGILILHDSHMHTALALDDLITTFEQDGYHFVQLVPAPGAMTGRTPGSLILGSSASAEPREAAGAAPNGSDILGRALALLEQWAAKLAVFGSWLGAEISRLWVQGLARLRH
jgi:peptidoglycan/xylan/chitin deacetylase (PgdA/CDA1 family)